MRSKVKRISLVADTRDPSLESPAAVPAQQVQFVNGEKQTRADVTESETGYSQNRAKSPESSRSDCQCAHVPHPVPKRKWKNEGVGDNAAPIISAFDGETTDEVSLFEYPALRI